MSWSIEAPRCCGMDSWRNRPTAYGSLLFFQGPALSRTHVSDRYPTDPRPGSGTGDTAGDDLATAAYGGRRDTDGHGRGGGHTRAPAWMSLSSAREIGSETERRFSPISHVC